MSGTRVLLSGPHAAALFRRALSEHPPCASTLWIVPTPACRDRVRDSAACRGRAPRVWTWDDLWAEVRARRRKAPAILSPAGTRAVLVEAIGRARKDGVLRELGGLDATAGYRRALADRIARWTRAGLVPKAASETPAGARPDEWRAFVHYRAVLREIDAEDRDGLARRAAKALREVVGPLLGPQGGAVVHDPSRAGRPALQAIQALHGRADHLIVTLAWDADPDRREPYLDLGPTRRTLLGWGFAESSHEGPPGEAPRPGGLAALGRGLFRSEPGPAIADADGLVIRGAPRGEGVALETARRVRDHLEAGSRPEEVLVLVPRRDDQADRILETLRAWGIPTCGAAGRSPAQAPCVAALLAALRLGVDGWEASAVTRLLRHGRFRPDWPEARGPRSCASAAAAIRDARAFRGLSAIRSALRGAGVETEGGADRRKSIRADRAREAAGLIDRLAAVIAPLDRPAPWSAQAAKARRLAEVLGLAHGDDADSDALEQVFLSLDDQDAVLDGLGRADVLIDWPDFVEEVSAIAREVRPEPEAPRPGCVRLAVAAEAEGFPARHVLLAGMEEGTFPDRDAVETGPPSEEDRAEADEPVSSPADLALARELRRFLGIVGMAVESLTLIYPATDEKGQPLLQSGFLEDVRRLLAPGALAACQSARKRLEPVLPAELAVAPAEARVRALGLACLEGQPTDLAELARLAGHRAALEGSAAALRVARARLHRRRFGPFDGDLADPRAVRRIADDFGPGKLVFSASQLETLAFCPFKFYLRHVLRLEPAEEREELGEDYANRGLTIHAALEELHIGLSSQKDDPRPLPERVREGVEGAIVRQLEKQEKPRSDVDEGLLDIEAERLRRAARRYAAQFERYHGELPGIECRGFEVKFGKREAEGHPGLVLGEGDDALGLQGMIDRIDILSRQGRTYFRVIDYKTGASPSRKDLESGLALQLPLYALAVQRHILADEAAEPLDVAYWELKKGGFKQVMTMTDLGGEVKHTGDWPGYLDRMEAFVRALVDRLRRAEFPVHPRAHDCTRFCEYRTVCRIGQVRPVNKQWPDAPRMEPAG